MNLFLRGSFGNGEWRERWEFWNQGPSRNGIALDSLPSNVSDIWEATRIAYRGVAGRKQATVWGEKSPHWADRPLHIAQKFPDARFIFLWRDMNAVMGSIAAAAATERPFKRLLARPAKVLLANERLRKTRDALKLQGKPVHEINYEDLTENVAESMQQICSFLKLPFEAGMTSLEGADRSAICAGQCHTLVKSDRIVDHRRKRKSLSPALQAKIGRYVSRWKRNSNGTWPKYPVELSDKHPASFVELCKDRVADQICTLWDKVLIILLHQIRPRIYQKKYGRQPQVAS
jgi:hypothetical protein